jgi:hypothetical protein
MSTQCPLWSPRPSARAHPTQRTRGAGGGIPITRATGSYGHPRCAVLGDATIASAAATFVGDLDETGHLWLTYERRMSEFSVDLFPGKTSVRDLCPPRTPTKAGAWESLGNQTPAITQTQSHCEDEVRALICINTTATHRDDRPNLFLTPSRLGRGPSRGADRAQVVEPRGPAVRDAASSGSPGCWSKSTVVPLSRCRRTAIGSLRGISTFVMLCPSTSSTSKPS